MTARRHHYLSQCYLNAFAVERKPGKFQALGFDRKTGESFTTAVENIGVVRDFNRVEIEGVEPDAFEAGMAKAEGEIAPALTRTIEVCAFQSPEDRNLVMNLISIFALRNPRMREMVRGAHEQTMRMVMEAMLSSKERWERQVQRMKAKGVFDGLPEVSYEDLKKFVDEDQYSIELNTEYHIQTEMKTLDTMLELISRRQWIFLRAQPDSAGFITSDHPVQLMWSNPKKRGGPFPPGFGLKDTQVLFPLSHKITLVGVIGGDEEPLDVSEEMVAAVNGSTIVGCSRQVFAKDANFHYRVYDDKPSRSASELIKDECFIRRDDEEEESGTAPETEAQWEAEEGTAVEIPRAMTPNEIPD